MGEYNACAKNKSTNVSPGLDTKIIVYTQSNIEFSEAT